MRAITAKKNQILAQLEDPRLSEKSVKLLKGQIKEIERHHADLKNLKGKL